MQGQSIKKTDLCKSYFKAEMEPFLTLIKADFSEKGSLCDFETGTRLLLSFCQEVNLVSRILALCCSDNEESRGV